MLPVKLLVQKLGEPRVRLVLGVLLQSLQKLPVKHCHLLMLLLDDGVLLGSGLAHTFILADGVLKTAPREENLLLILISLSSSLGPFCCFARHAAIAH